MRYTINADGYATWHQSCCALTKINIIIHILALHPTDRHLGMTSGHVASNRTGAISLCIAGNRNRKLTRVQVWHIFYQTIRPTCIAIYTLGT